MGVSCSIWRVTNYVKLLRDLGAVPDEIRSGAVSIGNFDGVHLGHARIVQRLIARAREVGGPAIVFTFDPHPVRVLRPEQAPPPLTWIDRKAQLLAELGVDFVIAYPTDQRLLQLTAQEFFDQIVRQKLDARAIVEGPNFFFGRDRQGTVERLRQMASAAGMVLDVVPPVEYEGEIVSSSRIRQLLSQGDVDRAAAMLTHPYRIRGMVTHGAARGARIGFPTANLDAVDTLIPAQGVYAGTAWLQGSMWPAAIHIGPNPTFDEAARKVEVHLIGFDQTIYGQPLEVEFLARLRGTQRFDSVEALKQQLRHDIQQAREAVDAWLRNTSSEAG